MKKAGWLALALFLASASWTQAAEWHKYDIKSGIVTLETVMTMGTTQIKSKKIIYFDEFGLKECQETYTNGNLSGVLFGDGKDKISLNLKKKIATRMGSATSGIGMEVDLNFMGTKKDIESGVVKKAGTMTVAGQTCDVIQVTRGGATDIYGGWNKFMVYLKTGSATMTTEIKATKLEANAAVPKEKFQVPAGFKVQ